MASLNRQELMEAYYDLKMIFNICHRARSPDVRLAADKAKSVAAKVEGVLGQVEPFPVECWGQKHE